MSADKEKLAKEYMRSISVSPGDLVISRWEQGQALGLVIAMRRANFENDEMGNALVLWSTGALKEQPLFDSWQRPTLKKAGSLL